MFFICISVDNSSRRHTTRASVRSLPSLSHRNSTLCTLLSGFAIVAVLGTVVLLILIVGFFFVSGAGVTGAVSNLEPLFTEGVTGITIVLVMVPFMFVGFDIIPQAAEEIDLPYRDIGTALILSVMMAIAWYALIIMGVGLIMSSEALATADLVTAEANSMIYGEMGETVLLVTGLAGIVTSWNALIVGASRALYAMAKAGMLPAALADDPCCSGSLRAILCE